MEPSIIIIGAGLAGLSAGCYGRMNGFKTTIYEMHNKPGGLCTAWKRKDYTFDGCVHWLTGCTPDGAMSGFYRVYRELGLIQGRQLIHHDEFLRIYGANGQVLHLYTDADRLERHLLEVAPEDAKLVKSFTQDIRNLARFRPPLDKAPELSNVFDTLKMLPGLLPIMGTFGAASSTTIQTYADRFTNPFLRETFPLLFYQLGEMPMLAFLMTLSGLHAHDSGYPIGGSLPMAKAVEARYLGLGGEVYYRSKVVELIVEGGRAVGVLLADGSEQRADWVISAADGHWTIFDLLQGRYLDDTIRGYYTNQAIYPPMVYVSLGINRDLSAEPNQMFHYLAAPIVIAGQANHWLGMRQFGSDPTMAPAGKSVVITSFLSDYAYWQNLHQDMEQYRAEKERISNEVIAKLEVIYPGITSQVEVVDVASPTTFERYTGVWKGSFMAWMMPVGKQPVAKRKSLPGLDRFYMAGQWVEQTGGIPSALKTGRDVLQIICKREGKDFIHVEP
jgi:phytoene dehydrogenase-like protein